MSVVEAIYDDYAKANFTNYEIRREDLNQLASFARQFKRCEGISFPARAHQQRRCGSRRRTRPPTTKQSIFLGASGKRTRVSHHLRHLVDGRNVSEQPFTRNARCH